MLDRLEKNAPASVATTLDWAIKLCLFQSRAEQRGLTWGDPQAGFALPQSNEEDGAQGPPRPVSKSLHGLHQELCEIDTRFGQVGDHGIFAALNRTGALAHHVAGVENIEHAMENPPTTGRARLRGDCVRRFAKENRRYACGWSGVYDREQNRLLDLSEPFATEAKWQQLPRGSSGPSSDVREWQAPVC